MAWYDAQKETIEMVAISSVVPLIPNMNVRENERWSFHSVSAEGGSIQYEKIAEGPTRYRVVVLTS